MAQIFVAVVVVEKVTFKTEKDNTQYKAEQNQTRTEWQMATEKKWE